MKSAHDYVLLMPPHIRPEFVAWLARREREAGAREHSRAARIWYGHGYHDGQQNNDSIYTQ